MINPNLKAGDEATLPPDTDLQALQDYWETYGTPHTHLHIEAHEGFYIACVEDKDSYLGAVLVFFSALAVIGTGAYIVWRLGGVG